MANADRIIELLHEAKGRPAGAERARFLDEACGEDSALKEQIISLLEADAAEGESDFLKITRTIRPSKLPAEKPGDRIGRYKLLEQIGEGGCGVVYMAEQEESVRRRVALKVIKLGMDTKQVIARFEAERQTLALMDHPNIAKVLDAGATETGRPFFVMELVRGIKITDYCDQNNLSTRERLELFIQVCQAIQHAHQKGIIHRDIKPSNILVTQHDDVAVPKVIDFGISKATVGQLTDKTIFTAFAQFVGTPAYMSPEQAQMSGLDIDTRADIYSLGVLLYELITGHTPFDAKELLAAGMDEMRRKIREDEPARPSTCLSTMEATALTTVAKQRHAEPPKLIHLIRGDLDWLVMKCLEKDRTRRYETANGLAMDLRRHLANEPVVARPPSNLYRFQKLVRRNKLAFAAASAVTAALLLGFGISTWMFFKEKQARQRAVAAEQVQTHLRRQAEAETAESRRLEEFLDSLAERLHQERNLTNAETVARQELSLEKKLSGDKHPFVANSLVQLAAVLSDAGKSNEAEVVFGEALDMCRKMAGKATPELASALSELGSYLSDQSRDADAEAIIREELGMWRRLFGNEHRDVAGALSGLGMSLSRQDKHVAAEENIREALAMQRKLLGNENDDVARSLGWLAVSLSGQGRHVEAESAVREALAMRRKLPADEPQLAGALGTLTRILLIRKRFTEAEPAARECLAIREKNHPDDCVTFQTRSMLGGSLLGQKKYAEAESLLLSGYEGMKQREGKIPNSGKVRLQESLQRLVQIYEATGQSEKTAEWNKKLAEFDKAEAEKNTTAPKP